MSIIIAILSWLGSVFMIWCVIRAGSRPMPEIEVLKKKG